MMADPEGSEATPRNHRPVQSTQLELTSSSGTSNPDEVVQGVSRDSTPPASGPSSSLWPGPTHLPYHPRREPSDNRTAAKAATRGAPSPSEEGLAVDMRESANGRFSIINYNSTQSRAATPDPPTLHQSQEPESFPQRRLYGPRTQSPDYLPNWALFPPKLAPEFGMVDPYVPTFPKDDLQNPTETYLKQSAALQEWTEKKNAERVQLRTGLKSSELIDSLRIAELVTTQGQNPDTRTTAQLAKRNFKEAMSKECTRISEHDGRLLREIENTWAAFGDIKDYEDQAHARRHRFEISRPRPQPKRVLSKVQRLLGSDGSESRPIISHHHHNQLHFLGSPTLYRMDYEESVTAGLEEEMGLPSGPPSDPKAFEVMVPEWFPVFESYGGLQIAGETQELRYQYLLNFIFNLESSIRAIKYKEAHPDAEGVTRKRYDKQWHEPSPYWAQPHHQKSGGHWKCRKGPGVPEFEQRCLLCHNQPDFDEVHPQEFLDKIMRGIDLASGEVAMTDKAVIMARMDLGSESSDDGGIWMKRLRRDVEELAARHEREKRLAESTLAQSTGSVPLNYNPLRGLVND